MFIKFDIIKLLFKMLWLVILDFFLWYNNIDFVSKVRIYVCLICKMILIKSFVGVLYFFKSLLKYLRFKKS